MSAEEFWGAYPTMLTTAETAEILRVSLKTVVRRLNAGELPGYRLGHAWIISRAELREHLERHTHHPRPPGEDTPDTQPEREPHPHFLDGGRPTLGAADLEALLRIDRITLYRWLEAGVIPATRSGTRWLVYAHQLRDTLEASRNNAPRYYLPAPSSPQHR